MERVRIDSLEVNLKSAFRNLKSAILLGATLVALCFSAEAQQPGKVYRVGRLSGGLSSSTFSIDALRRELRDLGYVEGKNIAFEHRYAEDKSERLPALADELVRLKVDVLVTPATPETLAAKNASRTIPILFVSPVDPVAVGLVDSLARPGGNITGFTTISALLTGKRLELLKETIPKLSRVAVLWDPKDPSSGQNWKESQLAARELGLQVYSMEVSSPTTLRTHSKKQPRRVAPPSPWRTAPCSFQNGSRTWRQKIDCRRFPVTLGEDSWRAVA